jgi:hypothetical protein
MTRRPHALIAITAIAIAALSGCASAGSPDAGNVTPAGIPSSAPSAAPDPSPALCTTHSCIAQDIQGSLPGLVAKDNAVITKAKCKASSVKDNQGGTYTAHCTAWYSDGSEAAGDATLITSSQKIAWEPTDIIVEPPGQ